MLNLELLEENQSDQNTLYHFPDPEAQNRHGDQGEIGSQGETGSQVLNGTQDGEYDVVTEAERQAHIERVQAQRQAYIQCDTERVQAERQAHIELVKAVHQSYIQGEAERQARLEDLEKLQQDN